MSSEPLRLVSWNMNRRAACWHALAQQSGVDIALVQEASTPPEESAAARGDRWETPGADGKRRWRSAVAAISDRFGHSPVLAAPLLDAQPRDARVSRPGTLAASRITNRETGEVVIVVSMYALWEKPSDEAGGSWIYADASAHRLVSDLSAFIGTQTNHSIIAAGDLNILHGHGENGSKYWRGRYQTVFDRMAAIGLPLVGPQAPHGGAQASPWPAELPPESNNVPTFRTRRTNPATATRQLDFVFASEALQPRLRVRALNQPNEWGPSDHCRILIELDPAAT